MWVGPQTLIEFQMMFPDEAACWAHLRTVRWPVGLSCAACGHGSTSAPSPAPGAAPGQKVDIPEPSSNW